MTVAELKIEDVSKPAVFRSILVASDFSEASRRALFAAVALAIDSDVHLSVVHVCQPDWRYEMLENPPEIGLERLDARHRLDTVIRSLGPDRKIDSFLVKQGGSVTEAVLSVIAQAEADLLVIGTRGRGGLSKLALGSVAEELLRTASCPVMTIGPKASIVAGTEGARLRTILFATDFGAGSVKAWPLVSRLVKAQKAKLIALHMIPAMPATSTSLSAYAPATAAADELQEWEESTRKRGLQQLRDWMAAQPGIDPEPDCIVDMDLLTEGILSAARQFKADLIVMGANQSRSVRLASHLPWSTVHEVIHDAPCPVLTVAG